MSEVKRLNNEDVSLVDILDAVLDTGVVLQGDLMISIADIDLVYVDLRLLISSVETLNRATRRKEIN